MAKRRRVRRIVPRLVLSTAVVSVVPALVTSCGGATMASSEVEAGSRSRLEAGVAADGFGNNDFVGGDVAAEAFGVADITFRPFDAADGEDGEDGGDASG
jgi:hypothetical protein